MTTESWTGATRKPGKERRRRKRDSAAPPAPPGESDLPVIRITAGNLPAAIDQAEVALSAVGPGPIFQRGGQLVHVADRPARRSDGGRDQQQAIVAIEQAALSEALAKAAAFEKYFAREKDWLTIDPPPRLAEMLLARPRWGADDIHQLIGTPTLRADGTLLALPGYDDATGLFLTSELPGLAVPDRPSRREADAANDMLAGLFASFSFVEDPPGLYLAVALAGLFGAMIRPTLPACPLLGVTAPAAGTGKSYLVDLISIIATGRRAVGVATGGRPEEFEKSLGAALLEGRPLLCLDNMVQPLAGQLLCITLSQERVAVRILGQSRSVEVPTSAALFATGNNLRVQGDMARRALLCRLDAGVERPEDRVFDEDLLDAAHRRRPELVSAVLTILRWHQNHSDPAPLDGRRFAGFETWCARIRDPLLALGHPDPVAALDATRGTDPDVQRLSALIEQWATAFADTPKTCAEIVAQAGQADGWGEPLNAELGAALVAATGDRPGAISTRKLAGFLGRFEGKIVDGRRFQRDGEKTRLTKWRLDNVS